MSQETVSTTEERAATSVELSQAEEKTLRNRARRRAGLCPGAGWALLGHPQRGLLALVCVAAMLATLAWLVISLSTASIWAAAAATVIAAAVWIAEMLDVAWCSVRPATESVLTQRYRFTTFVLWTAMIAVILLVPVCFGALAIEYDRMAPTLEPGDYVIYHRGAAESELRPEAIIVYRLPPYSKLGKPGSLEVARILAAPGDKLAVQLPKNEKQPAGQKKRSKRSSPPRAGHYLVNGEVTAYQGPAAADLPLAVPAYPKQIKVPDGCYFVVQDSEDTGIDSQQLEWLRRGDIVSTRLFDARRVRPVK